jgi:hypothetical protein
VSDLFISYDTGQPEGERLAPEVVAEIQYVAPSSVVNGAITEAKLADGSVSTNKIRDGAVTHPKIAVGAVQSDNIAPGAVGADKLAPGAVTPAALGIGVVTSYADDGVTAVETDIIYLGQGKYDGLVAAGSTNSNALYAITGP